MLLFEKAATSSHPRVSRESLAGCLAGQMQQAGDSRVAVLVVRMVSARQRERITEPSWWQRILPGVDKVVSECLRAVDRYAYLSEGKICLLLPGLSTETQAVLAAIRLRTALHATDAGKALSAPPAVSVGIAFYPDHGRAADDLVSSADTAAMVAEASDEGYCIYSDHDGRMTVSMLPEIDRQLANAIHLNEIPVHYQPQVDIRSGSCVGVEALLRWEPSGMGKVSPAVVVEAAEQYGHIAPLTYGVLNTALRQIAELGRRGERLNVSVNLSSKVLVDRELPSIVNEALAMWEVPAKQLTLEITESAMISDVERSISLLGELRELGVGVSIDDFGTGYSSLSYLNRLPLTELKIDRTFLLDMASPPGDSRIVKSLIDLARNFDLCSVAEGVEDVTTLAALREMGCHLAQGFYFSPGLSADDLFSWLRARPERA